MSHMNDIVGSKRSTSRRRRRQNVAPGVSQGIGATKDREPAKRATKILSPLTGLRSFWRRVYPGLTPGATNIPPANAGSLTISSIATPPANRALLVSVVIGLAIVFDY